jgi:enolase
VERLKGREVLDSRGNPTVQVDVFTVTYGECRLAGRGTAPSGASTGSNEALELRDADAARYLGKGTTQAAGNVTEKLSAAVKGIAITDLAAIDAAICACDGTELKRTVGGNAVTAASFACAEGGALAAGVELFQHFAQVFAGKTGGAVPAQFRLPVPMVNILNGGKHAGGKLKFQEFMILPASNIPFREALRHVTEVYHHLGKLLVKKYGLSAKNLGDEGGFAPSIDTAVEAFEQVAAACDAAGLALGTDIFLATDVAASEFYDAETGKYEVSDGKYMTSDELVAFYVALKAQFPALVSIEDGLDEKDYAGWAKLTAALGGQGVMIVGDDLYTTNTNLIKRGIEDKWANALLLKVNQIGTVSEAMDAAELLFSTKSQVIVSHRSGETPSSLIADLAVGLGAGYIKTGAPARGERIAKYNRLLQIEEWLAEHGMLATTA